MQVLRRLLVVLATVALCAPAATFAQAQTVPSGGSGVSTKPPVSLGKNRKPAKQSATKGAANPRAGALPNTGSDPRLLFLVGVAMTLLGVGLRLRTADAELY